MRPSLRPALLTLLICATAATAAAPPTVRPLSAEEKGRIDRLGGQVEAAFRAGNHAEVQRLSHRIVVLRESLQGRDHWEAVNARLKAQRWKRLGALTGEEAVQLGALVQNRERAYLLLREGKYAEAEKAAAKAAAVAADLFGADHLDVAQLVTLQGSECVNE